MDELTDDAIAAATPDYFIFAFDEGSPQECRQAKIRFNELVNEAYRALTKTALMRGFHRPTADEFRLEFITRCRSRLRRQGTI